MTFKGIFKQKYILDREPKELVVDVRLHQHEGMIEPRQNLYYGTATVDGKDINHSSLSSCVDAKLLAERIGKETIIAYKIKAKLEGKIFRLKSNK